MQAGPDSSAARVALWRALHLEVDAQPPVFEDAVGLRLLAPDADWRNRPDMDPGFTQVFRASILARARFVEDLVTEQAARGVDQYVLLGAGLDSFAQRRADVAARMTIFEIDQKGHQEWKRRRLVECGLPVPILVPVDFEAGESWLLALEGAGFERGKPAVITATGVSMYLTEEAIAAMLRAVAILAKGSVFAMTFMLPFEMADAEVRPGLELAAKGARNSGTPFISFYKPEAMLALARAAGFADVRHVSAAELGARYFAGRRDGLRPPANTEEFLVATAG